MPFRWTHAVKAFKFELNPIAALPVATVEQIGHGRWVMCCALCGCSHDVTNHKSPIYEPHCLVSIFAQQPGRDSASWRAMRADWLKQYPEAANHQAIWLVSDQAEAIPKIAPRKRSKQVA